MSNPVYPMVLSQADVDELLNALAPIPYAHAMLTINWLNRKIAENALENARIRAELDAEIRAKGAEPPKGSFFDFLDDHCPDIAPRTDADTLH